MKDLSLNYELKKLVGSGSFGDVYLCINRSTKLKYAMKLQKHSIKQTLKREIEIYKYLNINPTIKSNNKKIPSDFKEKFEEYSISYNINNEIKLKNFFSSSTKSYIAKIYSVGFYEIDDIKRYGFVMDLFEKSVSDFIKSNKLVYSINNTLIEESLPIIENKHVLMLGCLMLDAIESIHKKLLIHSDIKPANFVFQNGNLILIDFGLAKQIEFIIPKESSSSSYNSSDDNIYKQEDKKRGFRGTVKYASLFAHKGYPLSFKDDVESMIYLLSSLTELLPWTKKKRDLVPNIKNDYIPKYSLLGEVLIYLKSLKINEVVDYMMIKGIFLKEMRRNNWEFDMSIFS